MHGILKNVESSNIQVFLEHLWITSSPRINTHALKKFRKSYAFETFPEISFAYLLSVCLYVCVLLGSHSDGLSLYHSVYLFVYLLPHSLSCRLSVCLSIFHCLHISVSLWCVCVCLFQGLCLSIYSVWPLSFHDMSFHVFHHS